MILTPYPLFQTRAARARIPALWLSGGCGGLRSLVPPLGLDDGFRFSGEL